MEESKSGVHKKKNLFLFSSTNPFNGIFHFQGILILCSLFISAELYSQGRILTEENKANAIEEEGDLGTLDFQEDWRWKAWCLLRKNCLSGCTRTEGAE